MNSRKFATACSLCLCLSLSFWVASRGVAGEDQPAKLTGKKTEKTTEKSTEKTEPDKPKISVKIVTWDETLKLVAEHKGKVVVLDAWSTSCPPCMHEFPNLVKMHQKYGGKEVVCMSLSCDYAGIKSKPPEFYRERVEKFLTKQGAEFQNLMSSTPSEELFEKMEISSIPAVYVFGRDGRLAKRFDNEQAKAEEDNFTYEDVNKLVKELVAKK